MTDFRMPSLGADMDAGTVVSWRVAPGGRIARGEIIAEVETEKGVFEVESPLGGVVAELVTARGLKVPVGTVLARIEAEGVAAPPGALPGIAPATAPVVAPVASIAPVMAPAPVAAVAPAPGAAPAVMPARPRVSPLARRVTEAHGVDLARVTGTGPDGAITRADVERALAGAPVAAPVAAPVPAPVPAPMAATLPPSAPPPAAPPDEARRAMRHAVALAVARSKREIPHYYLATDVDLAAATAWLRAENEQRPVTERLVPAALFLKAVARALRAYPALNGFWAGDAAAPSAAIHLGVAISLRGGGLMAPAIHDADTLDVGRLMAALQDLVRRARTGGLRASEMTDPTITVTSLGDEGATSVFGVIYPPQLAIVGFGKVVERPWAVNGLLGVRPVVSVTLAADHRATDGHYGGRFLAEVDRLLQAPEAL